MRHPTDLHSGTVTWPKTKILVFSQDDAFRFLVRSTFRKLNVRDVLSTAVPDDAEHLIGYGPDIAVVDFDGDWQAALGFIARVKAAPRNPNPAMPILAAVKAVDRDVVGPAFNMGIEGVIPKPVSGHELTRRISDTLALPARAAAPSPAAAAKPTPPAAPKAAAPPPRPPQTPSPQPRPAAATVPAEPTAPLPVKPAAGRLAAGDIVASKRPAGGILPDLAPPPPASPPAKPAGTVEALAAKAPAQYRLEPAADDAGRKRSAQARADWQVEVASAGHAARTGADVARLDVTAFVAAHLAWLQSQGGQGARANVQGMDLAGADLSRTVLANATLREADLSDAVLTESRLDGADFRYARLEAADLSGANLGVAQLRHAKCRMANLTGAVLRGADLSGADLRGARMEGADLKGATMISCDLRGTDLSKAENMVQAQLDKAVCDMKTKLPPGLTRPARSDA